LPKSFQFSAYGLRSFLTNAQHQRSNLVFIGETSQAFQLKNFRKHGKRRFSGLRQSCGGQDVRRGRVPAAGQPGYIHHHLCNKKVTKDQKEKAGIGKAES
jgi:hypothetical protein